MYGITNDGVVVAFAEVVSRIKEFKIPKALLYEYSFLVSISCSYASFNYYTNLIDCNIYFCTRSLLNMLQSLNDMSDFKVRIEVNVYK